MEGPARRAARIPIDVDDVRNGGRWNEVALRPREALDAAGDAIGAVEERDVVVLPVDEAARVRDPDGDPVGAVDARAVDEGDVVAEGGRRIIADVEPRDGADRADARP